jgi:hypothetical protein
MSDTSRRDLMKAAAATGAVALAASAPSLAQAQGTKPMQNPAEKFPKPPFPEQRQKWPALQREM